MATIDLDDDEPVQTTTDRVARAVAPIVESGPKRTLALLAVAAGAGATASSPFDIITAMACVIVASELARRR